MDTKNEFLDKLKELSDAATPSPWSASQRKEAASFTGGSYAEPGYWEQFGSVYTHVGGDLDAMGVANADLIVFLRNSVPDILSLHERVQFLEKVQAWRTFEEETPSEGQLIIEAWRWKDSPAADDLEWVYSVGAFSQQSRIAPHPDVVLVWRPIDNAPATYLKEQAEGRS